MNGVDRRQDLSKTLVLEPPVADTGSPPESGHLPETRASKPRQAPSRRGPPALGEGGGCSTGDFHEMRCRAAWTERRGLSSSDAGRFGRAGGASRVRPRYTGGARVSDGGPFHPSASVPMKDELAIPLVVARRAGECRTNPQKILPCSQDTTPGKMH